MIRDSEIFVAAAQRIAVGAEHCEALHIEYLIRLRVDLPLDIFDVAHECCDQSIAEFVKIRIAIFCRHPVLAGEARVISNTVENPNDREMRRKIAEKLSDGVCATIELIKYRVELRALVCVGKLAVEHVAKHGDHQLRDFRADVVLSDRQHGLFEILEPCQENIEVVAAKGECLIG